MNTNRYKARGQGTSPLDLTENLKAALDLYRRNGNNRPEVERLLDRAEELIMQSMDEIKKFESEIQLLHAKFESATFATWLIDAVEDAVSRSASSEMVDEFDLDYFIMAGRTSKRISSAFQNLVGRFHTNKR